MINVYLDTKDSILLKSGDKSFHVLYCILRQINSENYIWYADKVNKNKITERLKMSAPSLEKHIASLKKKSFILPNGARGRYLLNLDIFSI